MNGIVNFWQGLSRSARAGFAIGLVAIVVIVGITAFWTLRTEYRILFSGLAESDLAAMVGELDKMKVPYRVGDDGGTLMVPEAQVHKTRLALMGRELPLHGAVGFELFNNMEFGVSEFVQKVNYQRALQGELTRTILSLEEVQSARVHLALPDPGLFRRDALKAKASVTLGMKPGRALQAAQVQGIQRLVAASVPEVQAQDVTVLDQHGVPLSRSGQGDAVVADAGAAQIDMKRDAEGYLAQKATQVLDRMFGKGESVVSVDAVFTQEHTKVTTEEVLPAHGTAPGQTPTGVIVRERQTTREPAAEGAATTGASATSTETDYQTGKRTEQVVAPAGALKRLQVAVVIKRPLAESDLARVRDIVAASIGLNRERGDVITVHSMDSLQATAAAAPASAILPHEDPALQSSETAKPAAAPAHNASAVVALAVLLGVALLAAIVWHLGRRGSVKHRPVSLTDAERARLLRTIREWVAADAARGTR